MEGYSAFRHPMRPPVQPPADADDRGIDPDREDKYRAAVLRSVKALCGMPFGSFLQGEAYDKNYWMPTEYKAERPALALLPGLSPSEALDAIATNKQAWKLDCAGWAQVCLALSHKDFIGARRFDKAYRRSGGGFILDQHDTPAVMAGSSYRRDDKAQRFYRWRGDHLFDQDYDEAYLLDRAPAGTLFIFANDDAGVGHDYRYEHSLRLEPDVFAAHGFGETCLFSLRELREQLAAITHPQFGQGLSLSDYADKVVWLRTVRYLNIRLLTGG
ncbi:MAG: hypothetical protein PSV23_00715 [Brevundimonas sp.]|uniref:hypothetical protein n=1 Tax=Brevundimonas sp. TaxID=1871086 RepID=UPI0024874D4B|nr:hypothetical protein [Brevundimonas sp.]MDI1325303.1 hypothetical protein [Brevundimonas sp.]